MVERFFCVCVRIRSLCDSFHCLTHFFVVIISHFCFLTNHHQIEFLQFFFSCGKNDSFGKRTHPHHHYHYRLLLSGIIGFEIISVIKNIRDRKQERNIEKRIEKYRKLGFGPKNKQTKNKHFPCE